MSNIESTQHTERAFQIARWAAVLDMMCHEERPDIFIMTDGLLEEVATPETAPEIRQAMEGYARRNGFRGGVEEARAAVAEALYQDIYPEPAAPIS